MIVMQFLENNDEIEKYLMTEPFKHEWLYMFISVLVQIRKKSSSKVTIIITIIESDHYVYIYR